MATTPRCSMKSLEFQPIFPRWMRSHLTFVLGGGRAARRYAWLGAVVLALSAAAAGCASPEPFRQSLAGDASIGTIDSAPFADGLPAADVSTLTALGGTCGAAATCASGFCVDGVCCESACNGRCQSCATAAGAGRCVAAEPGTDPRDECADQGAASCGTNGFCDGAGACGRYPAGHMCRAMACTGSTLMSAGTCNGAGVCSASTTQSCAPFTCGAASACRTTCLLDTECLAPATCVSSTCGRKPVGVACTAAIQCTSGICAQGVCCASACTATCMSCAVAGAAGTCTKVPVSANPQCPDTCSAAVACMAPAVCGNGFCGGLRAQYFETVDLTTPRVTRTDAVIDFTWNDATSPDPTVAPNTWSVRWLGSVVPRFSEMYTFHGFADDGIRLWIDDVQIFNDWSTHAARETSGNVALVAGRAYPLRLEYYNNLGEGIARLSWSSVRETKAVIPTANLRP